MNVIDEFLNCKLSIKLDNVTLDKMRYLKEATGLKWTNGIELDNQIALDIKRKYIERYYPSEIESIVWSNTPNCDKEITLEEFIKECKLQVDINDNEIMAIYKE